MKRAVIFRPGRYPLGCCRPADGLLERGAAQELARAGRRITAAQMQSWMGQGVRELARSILPERPLDTWFDAYLQYLHGENDYLLHRPPTLYPQLHQTFDALRAQGALAHDLQQLRPGLY